MPSSVDLLFEAGYPCFELDENFRILRSNTAGRPFYQNDAMFLTSLSEEEVRRLNNHLPITIPYFSLPGLVRSLNILPIGGRYLAVLECSVPDQNHYLQCMEKSLETIHGLFAALPMLQHFTDDSPESEHLLQYITQQSYKLLRASNDQTWSVRLRTGTPLHLETVDLNEILALLCQAVNTVMPHLEYPIVYENAGICVPVQADRTLLELVISHLLNNALLYTTDGNRISVKLQKLKSRAVVHVFDHGKGIKPEIAAHIFEPYFSCDPYCDTQQTPGNGLGLYLVQQGLRAMGGECALESEFGAGTHVSFTLPLTQEECALHARLTDYLMDRMSCVYQQFCPLGAHMQI